VFQNLGVNIGYARVSTGDQNLDLQRTALTQAGCNPVFEDQVSEMALRRPGLDRALTQLGAGDTLTVWRLDRLGRSLPHLIETIRVIGEKDAGFRSLTESIDTTTAGGRLYFHMMGALAEFERALIIERTRAGMKAAKARGVEVGRKRVLPAAQINYARLLVEGGESPSAVARSMKVGRSTLYRALNLSATPSGQTLSGFTSMEAP
jgi:DNA invertase Pin-like site-specific DNA recombinase